MAVLVQDITRAEMLSEGQKSGVQGGTSGVLVENAGRLGTEPFLVLSWPLGQHPCHAFSWSLLGKEDVLSSNIGT
jgi:hypothetical protein